MRPRPINSNTPPLATTFIMTPSNMYGQIDALDLTHPTMIKNGKALTLSNTRLSNVTQTFNYGQHHTLQHPHTFHSNTISQKMMYLLTLTSQMHITLLSNIFLIIYSFTLYLSRLILHVQIYSFTEHAILRTHALSYLFLLS